jgi:hypothetical protein
MSPFLLSSKRREFLLCVVLPFLIWIFCFWDFLTGRASLTMDALSYYEHISFFTNNISQGVYPLWSPVWCDGAPYNFFLRRIGEVNPFYWIVGGLKLLKVSNLHAYLAFLTTYYFLAVAGFWLIAKLLFRSRLASSAAFLILLFSGWGSQLFYNYIIILFVPLVWFFYFLFSFAKEGKRHQFLGMFFAMALVVTTYIPFFVMTVIALFLILFPVFFWKRSLDFISCLFSFIRCNKVFVAICLAFFVLACVPAIDFYHESNQGEFVMPGRHEGTSETSAVAVAMKRVKDGDILAQGYFDKTFLDHQSLAPGDFFISYFFFLVCLVTVITPLTRRAAFLLVNAFLLGVISMTETSPVYQFLYDHVFFFKYMRMMSYLFWIAALPMIILLVVGQMRVFFDQYQGKFDRRIMAYIVLVHVVFGAWALTREGVTWTSWLVVILSLAFFLAVVIGKWNQKILWGLLLALVVVQPLEMCRYLVQNTSKGGAGGEVALKKKFEYQRSFIATHEKQDNKDVFLQQLQRRPYYASRWYADVFIYVPANDLEKFTSNKLYLYDSTLSYAGTSPEFFQTLGEFWRTEKNVVVLPKDEILPEDIRISSQAPSSPEVIKASSRSVKVESFDANTLSLKTAFDRPRFLLWSDSYHSGWHVSINGKEARVLRANYAFKGLWIPAGENHVIFRFGTLSRFVWVYFTLIFFALALGFLVFFARREGLFVPEGADDGL